MSIQSRPAVPHNARIRATLEWAACAVGLGLTALLLHKMSLLKPLDHDEHQFIASGASLARFGWLPYLDAPYHHLPYLSFLYAALYSVSDALLGTARAACVTASVGIVALTGYAVADATGERPDWVRAAAVTLAIVVLISNPIFVYTSGRAWNHDLAMFLMLAAALLHMRWLAGNAGTGRMFVAGALLAAAIGTRSSFALVIPAFVASLALLGPATPTERLRATGAFATGGFMALLPVALLFGLAPEQFLFGNLRYNVELNTEYRRLTHWPLAMDLGGKLDYVSTEILSHRRNWLLVLLYGVALGSAGLQHRLPKRRPQHLFIGLLLTTLLFSAWSPTPTWHQYFFAIVPVIIIASALALSAHVTTRSAAAPLVVAALLATTSIAGLRHYGAALGAGAEQSQVSLTQRIGRELAEITPPGRVATLGPIFALQADRGIYSWLVTGPFSWRTAPLVDAHERRALGLVGPDELAEALRSDPPVAIVVGVEPFVSSEQLSHYSDPEAALIEYARSHDFQPHPLSGGLVAWLPKKPTLAP